MSDVTHIKDLKPDTRNARKHTPRNTGMIERSLNEVGAARSIVIDEENNILAGNGTIEAAAAAGIERVQVIDADGETIIAVRRSGLTKEQKQRLALYDNRTAELAEWDTTVLAEILEEQEAALDGLFNENELDRILGESLEPDPNELWKGMPEFNQEDQSSWKMIKVHFANQEDYQAFAQCIGQSLTDKTISIWYPAQERADLKAYRCRDES